MIMICICTNLYDVYDPYLKSATKHSDWNRTKDLIHKDTHWIIKEIKKSSLHGRGGVGFSAAALMVVNAKSL